MWAWINMHLNIYFCASREEKKYQCFLPHKWMMNGILSSGCPPHIKAKHKALCRWVVNFQSSIKIYIYMQYAYTSKWDSCLRSISIFTVFYFCFVLSRCWNIRITFIYLYIIKYGIFVHCIPIYILFSLIILVRLE